MKSSDPEVQRVARNMLEVALGLAVASAVSFLFLPSPWCWWVGAGLGYAAMFKAGERSSFLRFLAIFEGRR